MLNFFKSHFKVFLPLLALLLVVLSLSFIRIDHDTVFPGLKTSRRQGGSYSSSPDFSLQEGADYKAYVKTSYGDFKINLFGDLAPRNVNNFVFLAEEGFYNGLVFHRIIPGFIIQVGHNDDIGIGYFIEDEISDFLRFGDYTVAMANEDRVNTNKSQFFVVLPGANVEHLNNSYTIFGRVESGFEVIDNIGSVSIGQDGLPLEEVSIESIIIEK